MKIIIYIFSLYIIILSCLPCADSEPVPLSIQEIAAGHQSGEHQHHDNDVCSPLCACSCCGCQGFSFNILYVSTYFSVKTLIDKKVPEYKSIPASNFYGSIWQPPQIV